MAITVTVPDHLRDSLIALGLAVETAPQRAVVGAPPDVSTVETPADAGFTPPPWYGRLRFALTAPSQRGATVFGPRGSGKTTAVHRLAAQTGAGLVTYQAAAGCVIDDLVGVRDLVDGRTVFTRGPLAEALERDCWLLIEEANVMHPGVFSKLNTLTDGSGDSLRLPDGSALPVGPGFRVILAFNEGAAYSGTREVNAALRDRLMPIYADYLPAAAEVAMLRARTGCDEATAAGLVEFAGGVRAARASLGFDLSPRALLRMLDLIRHCGCSWAEALEFGVLDLVGDPVDRRPQRDAIAQIADLQSMAQWNEPDWAEGAESVATVATDEEGEA